MENDSTSKEAYLFAYHKCVKAGKLTGKTMIKLLKWAVVKGWNKISASNTNRHGKQRIKQLIRKDQGVTSVDVSKTELRDFQILMSYLCQVTLIQRLYIPLGK
ncbi:DUF3801 domain-containing protein [Butyrivibrio sp. AE3006]|uniref:DUF3801 domain-containing protein n=1 Tax=Butyrivibrio sp. AE3006 TaxID=1280673 RepID=UPI00040DE07F|nr:DUF3801 domain-containing protein [Butyrivibrio sp. AE3006]